MNKPVTFDNTLRVAVDIGGTFTDGVATLVAPRADLGGEIADHAGRSGEAVTTVIKDLLRQVELSDKDKAPALAEVVHGTTLITNTLIERRGREDRAGHQQRHARRPRYRPRVALRHL